MAKPGKLMPPHYFLMTLLAQAALDWFFPQPVVTPVPVNLTGIVFVLAGMWIASSSSQRFARRGTAIRPFEESSHLVTDGWFRFSRNPMYVAMLMINVGIAILLGSAMAFLPPVLLAVILYYRFIRIEERMLQETFGRQYEDYRKQMRRWL